MEFERLTRVLSLGFIVGDHDFQKFLEVEFQMIDGYIDAFGGSSPANAVYTLECVDTSQWEITTTSDSLAAELEKRGFTRLIGVATAEDGAAS